MKRFVTCYAVAVLAMALVVSAQTAELTGKWKIKWPAPGKPNMVTLRDHDTKPLDGLASITGDFISDDGEVCPVNGSKNVTTEVAWFPNGKPLMPSSVDLHVTCAKFQIEMVGKISVDNDHEITGIYTSEQFPTGKFTMELQICMLPEGCTTK